MKKIILALLIYSCFLVPTTVQANISTEHITTMFRQTLAEKHVARVQQIARLFDELGLIKDTYDIAIALHNADTAHMLRQNFSDGVKELQYLLNQISAFSKPKRYFLQRLSVVQEQLAEMRESEHEYTSSFLEKQLNSFLPFSWEKTK